MAVNFQRLNSCIIHALKGSIFAWRISTIHHPHFSHEGQPYSNRPHCRRFDYEHVTVKQRSYHRPKKTTSDILYLGQPNLA